MVCFCLLREASKLLYCALFMCLVGGALHAQTSAFDRLSSGRSRTIDMSRIVLCSEYDEISEATLEHFLSSAFPDRGHPTIESGLLPPGEGSGETAFFFVGGPHAVDASTLECLKSFPDFDSGMLSEIDGLKRALSEEEFYLGGVKIPSSKDGPRSVARTKAGQGWIETIFLYSKRDIAPVESALTILFGLNPNACAAMLDCKFVGVSIDGEEK